MTDFSNKTAVVTGAAGGMGYAISDMLVQQGATVRMLDLLDPGPLPTGAGHAEFHLCDLTDPTSVAQAFTGLSTLDHLVNAAGILLFGKDKGVLEIDLETWAHVMDVNLKSMVLTHKNALPLMLENGSGSIVNFSTIQCLRGDSAPQDAYQASKAGVIALTKSVAIQYAAKGIRANTILPGPSETPMQDRWRHNPVQLQATRDAVPLGRVGRAEDMANACLFLLSDKAAFITGTELPVDGGLLALP
ncbi:MAG: SDR family oxidoreductase [Rhodobacteraceae bacterium]|nr:SDR family oxidoreductase [Paracoccaceae bacterium]